MSGSLLLLLALLLLSLAYFSYGALVARWLGVDPKRETPAHRLEDGVDYVPAPAPVLLGHHFASIAGAAPIIGPATALAYGWLPVYLWLIIGVIFLGAVHDLSALIASVRHEGRSIGELIEAHLGTGGKTLFLLFSWSALLLVVAIFAIVVARTFAKVPSAATASSLFLLVAVAFGLALRRLKLPLSLATLLGLLLLGLCLFLGERYPLSLNYETWIYLLLIYISVAATAPVWVLLQPRDYLNSFLLYAMLILGIAAIFFSSPSLEAPAIGRFEVEHLGLIFPALFVTVACGAISGFHALVASGTTAKQLHSEGDARLVGYGAMLLESLLAIMALIAVAHLAPQEYSLFMGDGGGAVAAFSEGLGRLISELGLSEGSARNFVALTVSAFALTSLDTATRLTRFAFQEFFQRREGAGSLLARNRYLATGISVSLAAALIFSGTAMQIWPLFGAANQLLAALTLLAVSLWLSKRARARAFVIIPMFFMFAVTLTALAMLTWRHLGGEQPLLGAVALLLLLLALALAGISFKHLFLQRSRA